MNRMWELVCQRRGARYVHRPVPLPIRSADEVIEDIWSGVTEHTRALYLSHITSPTALILPIDELVRRAREVGILTVIDGAHAPGQVPVDLQALGPDFYGGNCHKWMNSPKGAGFLYARRGAQPLLEPLIGGRMDGDAEGSRLVGEHEYQGTRDLAAFLAVPAAIRFMEDRDWPTVQRACHELVCYARDEFAAFTGLSPVCPDDPAWFAQMAVLRIPPCDTSALYCNLWEEHAIEIPVCTWNGQQFLRLSVQAYNTREDVAALIQAVKAFFA
jgi:isopenicillin-N epimerase